MNQIFNIDEDSNIKLYIPERLISIKETDQDLKRNNSQTDKKKLSIIEKKETMKNKIKIKPINRNSINYKKSSFKKLKLGIQKIHSKKTLKLETLKKKNKLSKLGLFGMFNIFNMIKIFVNILKFRIFSNNFKNLNIKHLNIIDDWAYNANFKIIKPVKMNFELLNITNRIFKLIRISLNKGEKFFPLIPANNKLLSILDFIVLLNSIYFVVLTPVELSFQIYINEILFHENIVSRILPIIVLIIDIIIKFQRCYYENGNEIMLRNRIIEHYIEGGFIFDILSLLSLIYYYVNEYSNIRLLILCKIFFINEFFQLIEEKLNLNDIYDNILQIIKLFLNILYTAHFLACIFHAIAYYNNEPNNWLNYLRIKDEPFQNRYVYSMYWAIETLATVGYGDIVPQNLLETFFCSVVMILGCGVFAYCINSFGYIFSEMMRKKNKKNFEIKILNGMMKRKNLNSDLQNKVRNFFESISSEEDKEIVAQENILFKKLSKELQKEIILNSNANILKKCKLFCNTFSEEFLQSICFKMKHQSYVPDEILFEDEQLNDISIFFITKGKISCSKQNTRRGNDEIHFFDCLKDETLGEFNLITDSKYHFNAKSIGLSSCYIISKKDFLACLEKFPGDKEKYFYLRDQLLIDKNYKNIDNYCKLCKNPYHLTENCEFIRISKNNRNKIIYKYLQSNKKQIIHRSSFIRNPNKKARLVIENNEINESFNQTLNSKLDIENEKENTTNIKEKVQMDSSIILKDNDKEMELSPLLKKKATLTKSKIDMSYTENDFLKKKEIENQNNIKLNDQDKKKNLEKNKDLTLFDFNYDNYRNFQYFYPHNNFNNVLQKFSKIQSDQNNFLSISSIIGLNNHIKGKKNTIFKFNENSFKNRSGSSSPKKSPKKI